MHAKRTSHEPVAPAKDVLALLEWKRRILELYADVREAATPERGWQLWRDVRDELFREHSQSPLPTALRERFAGLEYFPYDPSLRVLADVTAVEPVRASIGASGGTEIGFVRFGRAAFRLAGRAATLDLFWLDAYGGGVFLPFSDETGGSETFGGGRYLLDTVKGADLGSVDGRLVLDFNFAYNPSCAYAPHWICPLSPPPNRLLAPVRAGEKWRPPQGGRT